MKQLGKQKQQTQTEKTAKLLLEKLGWKQKQAYYNSANRGGVLRKHSSALFFQHVNTSTWSSALWNFIYGCELQLMTGFDPLMALVMLHGAYMSWWHPWLMSFWTDSEFLSFGRLCLWLCMSGWFEELWRSCWICFWSRQVSLFSACLRVHVFSQDPAVQKSFNNWNWTSTYLFFVWMLHGSTKGRCPGGRPSVS